jgi:hypothetical protein
MGPATPMKNATPRAALNALVRTIGTRQEGRSQKTAPTKTVVCVRGRAALTPPPCLGGGSGWGSSEEAPDVCFLRRFLVLIFMT